jgi:hypothetical protein
MEKQQFLKPLKLNKQPFELDLKFKFRKYENGKWSFEFKNTHTAPKKIL